MIYMLPTETCSLSIPDPVHIPNPELFGRLFDEGISESKQFDHNNNYSEITGS